MEQYEITSKKIDSVRELENLVDKKQIIYCDEVQNTFLFLEFHQKEKMGIAYYDYGIPPDFKFSINYDKLYVGLGINFIYIDICNNKVIFNHKLFSVFYELLFAHNRKYVCVVCELDVYCYLGQERKWSQSFKNIIQDFCIIDDINILIQCADNTKYLFSIETGKILEVE